MSKIEITQEDRAKRLVQIIEGAGHDWSVNLTRLVDGVSEYTLTYHGDQSIHPGTEEAYARLRKLQEAERSGAVLEYVQNLRHEARAEALEEAAKACDTIANAAEQGGDFFTHCPHRCAISIRALRSGEREG